MPYSTNAELPKPVRDALPDAAQTMWRKAHDAALTQYSDEGKAAATAWAAVKRKYRKEGDVWVAKSLVDRIRKRTLSLDERAAETREAWRDQYGNAPGQWSYVTESYDDHVVICFSDGDEYWSVPYVGGPEAETIEFAVDQATQVERDWVPLTKTMDVPIAKIDDERGQVFGWAYQTHDADGVPRIDNSGDVVQIGNLEDVAYGFVKDYAKEAADDMHVGEPTAQLIEAVVVTPEKAEALGFAKDHKGPFGLWVGFEIDRASDAGAAQWNLVKSGDRPMLSIAGTGTRSKAADEKESVDA